MKTNNNADIKSFFSVETTVCNSKGQRILDNTEAQCGVMN